MDKTSNKTAQSIYPAVRYNDAKAAIAWLKSALGFEEHVVYAENDGSIAHAELSLNGNLIMLGNVKDDPFGRSPRDLGGVTGTTYIALDTAADIDKLYARAKAVKAEIVRELGDTDYGSHDFGVRDPEGHVWSFGTYRPEAV
jgi:uncharacterized glyoxalase superfamily protein PhnB